MWDQQNNEQQQKGLRWGIQKLPERVGEMQNTRPGGLRYRRPLLVKVAGLVAPRISNGFS